MQIFLRKRSRIITSAFYGLMLFETALLLLVPFFLWPFIRPEAALALLWKLKDNLMLVFPLGLFFGYILISSMNDSLLVSVTSRFGTFNVRYLCIFLPFIGFTMSRNRHWLQGAVSVVLIFLFLKAGYYGVDPAYTFDRISMKATAERLNAELPIGARVRSHEVQIRYWLRDDITVVSDDGVIDNGGEADYVVPKSEIDFWR